MELFIRGAGGYWFKDTLSLCVFLWIEGKDGVKVGLAYPQEAETVLLLFWEGMLMRVDVPRQVVLKFDQRDKAGPGVVPAFQGEPLLVDVNGRLGFIYQDPLVPPGFQ